MTDRTDAVDRLMRDGGGSQTFTRVKGKYENLPLIDPHSKYFVYNLSHVAVPPYSPTGPLVRILGGFETNEEAVSFAMEVHEHDQSTVLVGTLHEWFVCCNSIERLQNNEVQLKKRESLLKLFHTQQRCAARENEKFHALQKRTGVSVEQWLKEVTLPLGTAEALCAWASENHYTHERCGSITTEEGEQINVDAAAVRTAHAAWLLMCDSEVTEALDKAYADDPVPEDDVDTASVTAPIPEGPTNEPQTKLKRFDPSLETKAHQVAVITVVQDTCTEAHREPLLRVMGLFDSTDTADAYVRNVAGNVVRDHNMFVVDLYKWIDFEHSSKVMLQHRDEELQNIMQWNESQASQIASLQNDREEPQTQALSATEALKHIESGC